MLITPKSKNMEKESRLSKATEALVEAALLDAGTASQKELASKLEALQISFDNKINTLNQHLVKLKKDMSKISSSIQEENKQKTLERALSLTHLNSFVYYEDPGTRKHSADLAKEVIEWFMIDHGYYLTDAMLVYDEDREISNEETMAFLDKFKAQIKALIKREPRLEQEFDGRFLIYYS